MIIHTVHIYMSLYTQSIFICDYTHSPYLYVIIHTVHIYMWLYTQSIFCLTHTVCHFLSAHLSYITWCILWHIHTQVIGLLVWSAYC